MNKWWQDFIFWQNYPFYFELMYSECLKLIDLYSKICLFDVSPVINYNFYAFIFLSEHMSTDSLWSIR